ncbi:retention module-containing protein [Pseudomonas sp. X4]|uniref:retention module-containing protein n=1 Tax=Pseudomonas sp. X4 TaxID=3231526 RepID=UPI00345FD680
MSIAIVKSIVGQVIAISPEGTQRVLVEGDRVFAGEQIQTGPGGAVSLELADGRILDLGRDTQWSADAPDSVADLSAATAQAAPSVDELQQAIAAGADPTTALEATAAGPTGAGANPGGIGGGHSFVMLEAVGGSVAPTIGFPTGPLGVAVEPARDFVGNSTPAQQAPVPEAQPEPQPIAATLTLSSNNVQEGGLTSITGTLSQPAGRDFTVTLSNGQTLSFKAGETVATTGEFAAQSDDVFQDGEIQNITVTNAGDHGFGSLNTGATSTLTVTDTVDTVRAELSISPNPAVEGQAVTYTITLTGPAGADLTQHGGLSITLSNGEVINIPAGQVSASQTANLANDVYVGSSAPSIAINGITEQGTGKQVFENLVKGDPVTLQITDEPGTPGNPGTPGTPNGGDAVTLTLTGNAVQEGNTTTITGTLSHPAGQAFTVTLSNGQTLSFAEGALTATTNPFVAQSDDVFKDGETQTVSVIDAGSHNFENLNTSATTTVTVSDTVDTVKAELSISPNPAVEGQAVTYTITLTGPAGADLSQHGGLSIALSNGKVVHIAAGQISGSQSGVLADNVYVGSSAPSIAISGITEQGTGKQVFENLVKGDPVTLQITDEPGTPGNPGTPGTPNGGDEVTLTLTGNAVQEGNTTTITGTLSHPAGQAFTVTLSNGQTLTFAEGALTATTNPFVAQSDDVFKDGETQTVSVIDAGSHNFENLNTSATTTVTVSDTVDTVKAELSISPNPAVEGQAVTYTITLTGPAGADLNQHGGLSIALSNGEVINIPAGQISGSQSSVLADNVYVGSSAPSIAISGITEQGTGKQVFENLVKGDPVTLQITDEPGTPGTPNGGDEVTLTLTGNAVQEGNTTTITGTLSHPAGQAFTVTLSNGQTLSFAEGALTATTNPFVAQSDDVFKDGETQTVSVIDAGSHNFENLNTSATTTVTVSDTVDTVKAELSISPNPAVEGQAVTYTITLTGPAGADLSQHGGLSIALSNGKVVHIAAGQISGSQSGVLADNVYVGSSAPSIAISGITEQGTGKQVFENLVKGDPVTLQITDEPGTPGNPGTPGTPNGGDEVTLTLTGNTVQEGNTTTITGTLSHPAGQAFTVTLSNGQTLTFAKDATTATTAPFVAQSDDVFRDGETQAISVIDAGSHNFENLNISATTTVTVSDTVDTVKAELSISPNPAVEGQAVTYTITLTGPAGADLTQHGGLSIALSNGEVINIPAGQISGSQSSVLADNVYVGSSAPSIAISGITEQGTGKQVFENLVKGDPVTLQITDEPGTPGNPGTPGTPNGGDEVTLTLTGNAVQEGNTTTITGTLSHPAGQAFTVTLSNGQTLSFAEGALTATTNPFVAQSDDVFKDGETQTVSLIDAGSHNFENLNTSATTTITVSDTVDTVKAELSISPNPAVEGQAVTYTITLTGPAGADLSQHGGLSIALSNGEVINIPAGQVSASQTANLADNVYVGSSAPSIAINGITEQGTGKQVFENLVKGDPVTLQITDEPGTPGNPGTPGTPNGGDEVTLTLTGNTVQEGNTTTITGTLSHPAGQAFTVTLSNGQTLTFAEGALTATTNPFVAQSDDVFKDGETQTVSVIDAGSHNFENLNTSATTTVIVSDTVDTVKAELSISPNPAVEGQAVTYTITLTGPAGADLSQHGGLSIALSNGEVINIPAGQVSASQTANLADDVYVGSSAPSIAINGITEQGTGKQVFENLVKGDPVTLQITDEPGTPGNPGTPGTPNGGDEVTLTLTGNTVQEGNTTTITGTLSHPAGQAFTVTLSNGQTLTFAKDATTATTAPFVAQSDDVFRDGETQTISVTNAGNHNFENLNTSATTTVTVSDTVDTVKAELSISPNPAVEGQAVTYTITLTGPAGADLTQHGGLDIELSNGKVVHIAAGQISGSQSGVLADNVYVGSSAPSIAINGITEQGTGKQVFENLVKGDPVTLQITDEPGTPGNPGTPGTPNGGDEVTLTLTGNAVQEGGQTTITGTLSHPAGQAFTVTLSNGQTLTFAKDATTATTAPFVAQSDDVFRDGETQTISVIDAGSHNFENLNISATTTVTVSDTVDTVKAELSISPNPAVEGQAVTYTITLTGPAGADLTQHGGLDIELSNGKVVHIAAGQISGSQSGVLADNVYVGSSAPSIAINGITEQGTGKQVFENLVKGDPVTLQITDEPGTPGNPGTPGTPNGGDEVTLTLTGNAVQEGGQTTITGTLSHPAGQAFTVTLSNGQTLTFAKDATTATTAPFVAQSDDVFRDGETQTISVIDAGSHNFENLNISATTTVTVSDTVDTVKAELSISPNPAVEGQAVTYTITLTGPAGADLTQHGGLSIALSNGEVINIPAGQVSASQTANLADDVYVGSSAPSIAINGITEQGAGKQVFENLIKGDPVTLQITDEPGTPGNPGTPGTPNGGDEVTLTLTGNTVQEGHTTTITGTLSHPAGQAFTVTLSNGQTLSFAKDATTATTAPFVAQSDDVFRDGETQTISVTNAGTHNFENLNTSATTTLTVTDTINTVTVVLSASPNPAAKGQEVTYTVNLEAPAGMSASNHGGLTIKLDNGLTIMVAAGSTTGTVKGAIPDGVFVGGGSVSVGIDQITQNGTGSKVFENLVPGASVAVGMTNATPTITSGAALVSEEGLIGGNKDTVGSPADQSDSKLYAGKLTVSDIDTPSANLSVSLAAPSTALTSSGQSVQWALSNGGKTLTGTAGGKDVIEIRIDNAGNYTVELKGPLDHPNQAAEDVLSLNVGVSVSDGSTSSTGTLTISVEDDSPTFATSDNAGMWNTVGYTAVGDTHFLAGGDGVGTLKFGTIVGLPSGWSSKATDASGTTVEVFDGTTKVFTLALGADGHYTVTQNSMREGSRDTFNLESLKSGNTSTLPVTFTSGITATFEALASATGKPTINVGNGLGVGNNHFSANEKFSVAFTDALQHAVSMKEVTLGIARLQVSGDVNIVASYKDANGVVHEATKTYTITSGSESIKILASDFAGLAGHAFDTITLAAPSKSTLDTTFTKLTYVEEKPASDLNFTVHVIGTDHDGDSASSSFVVTSHGDAASSASMSTMSLMASDTSDSASTSLLGSEDHIVFVGAGDSTVTGSSGIAESFVWTAGDTGHDVVRNFNAEEGDRLDLSALLQGESLSAIDSYLKITTVDGESTLQVSTQGKFTPGGDTSSADVSIKLEGVNWSNTTVSSLVSGGDPTIKIDHSGQ